MRITFIAAALLAVSAFAATSTSPVADAAMNKDRDALRDFLPGQLTLRLQELGHVLKNENGAAAILAEMQHGHGGGQIQLALRVAHLEFRSGNSHALGAPGLP